MQEIRTNYWRIGKFGDLLDKEDPTEPMVISTYKINAYLFIYKRYTDKEKALSIEDDANENRCQMRLVK